MTEWPLIIYVIPLFMTAAIAAGLAGVGWHRRPAPGAVPFTVLMLAVSEWALASTFELASFDLSVKIFWTKVLYVGVVLVPITWLMVVFQYTGHGDWITHHRLALLSTPLGITLLLVWTNEAHQLIWQEVSLNTEGPFPVWEARYGPWFWIHASYSYFLLLSGTIVVLRTLIRFPYLYRYQALMILISTLAPWVGNVIYLAGLSPLPGLDLTPFGFTVTGLGMGWGLFRYQLLNVVPAAHKKIFESMSDGIIVLDTRDRIVDLNPAAEEILGSWRSEMIGQPAREILVTQPNLLQRLENRFEGRAEIVLGIDADERDFDILISPVYDRRGRQTGRLVALRDITARKQAEKALRELNDELEQRIQRRTADLVRINQQLKQEVAERKRIEQQLIHDAFHDALTGLPNRALFMDRLERALARASRNPQYRFAVLFLDLDRFKVVNDSMGHLLGDELLVSIARRLEARLRSVDTVARLGGDEFVILLEDIRSPEDAVHVAEQIQKELRTPFELRSRLVFTSASIGIVLSTGKYHRPEDMMRDADIAMYRAKVAGKAQHVIFDTEMRATALARMALESDLRQAIEQKEFVLHYQPIVCLFTGELAGFEALIRWRHPRRGLIAPLEFIPIAEETGFIIPTGEWVLREACRQMRLWQQATPFPHPLFISVNLSARQFAQPNLVDQIEQILCQTGLEPEFLKLELTESVVMEDAEKAIEILTHLIALGVQIQIDDFGTGYSSLSYLHRFPIASIKIDRSFVTRIGWQNNNTKIVQTIMTLTHDLGLHAVAEGIETAEHLAILRELKCELGQGFFFSMPVDHERAFQLIQKHTKYTYAEKSQVT